MAISVQYRRRIPYPFERVLAQYFDLEHFETVHPKTLGQCRVLDVVGNRILFEQRWPFWLGVRLRTTIEQVWEPPDRIQFRFVQGFLRGVGVSTHLTDGGDETRIEEVYRIPLIPDWSRLRPPVSWVVDRGASGIWEEDLAVELCHGGWPGIPGREAAGGSDELSDVSPVAGERWIRVAEQAELDDGQPCTVEVVGREIVLWRHTGRLHALDNRCSHSNGPLALGWLDGDQVVCPWHGARFCLADGRPCSGPAETPVATYPVREEGRGVFIRVVADSPTP